MDGWSHYDVVLSCLGLDILQLAKIVINSSPVFRQRPPTTAAAQEGGGERKRERERKQWLAQKVYKIQTQLGKENKGKLLFRVCRNAFLCFRTIMVPS